MARIGPRSRGPCAHAEERSGLGGAGNLALQHLTHRACLSGVSAANAASCTMRPGREHRRLPGAPAQGRGHRGRLLFGYFLLARQEKVTALSGAHPDPWCSCARSVFYRQRRLIEMRRWGLHPHTPTYFSCFAKQSKQKKATPVPLSFRFAPGNLRCTHHGLHRATRCIRFAHSAQTSTMSQILKRKVPLRSPWRCAPRQGHRGNSDSGHRCARPGMACAARGCAPPPLRSTWS